MKLIKKKGTKRISKSKLSNFFVRLSGLVDNGFTLQDSLKFISKNYEHAQERQLAEDVLQEMGKGRLLHQCFINGSINGDITSQLQLAEFHGDFSGTLRRVSYQLKEERNKIEQLIKIITYPLMLIIFLMIMMFFMKFYFMPKMLEVTSVSNGNIGYYLVDYSPFIISGILIFGVIIKILTGLYLKNKSAIETLEFYMRIPFIKIWNKYHCTCYFCQEWGKLLELGVETKQIITIFQKDGNTNWITELSYRLEDGISNGKSISQTVSECSFFLPSLIILIDHGEAMGKLGKEMQIYSQECWNDWLLILERWIMWIQPIIFLIVGLLLISLYAAILLPIYSGIGGI